MWIDVTDWRTTPASVDIAPREVHVWRASAGLTLTQAEQLISLLPAEEQARFSRLRRESAAVEYAVGRTLLRGVLGAILGARPEALRFAYSAAGKPSLAWPAEDVRFSLSHGGGRVLLAAAAGRDVGVDVESMRPVARADRIAHRIFPPATQSLLEALAPARRRIAFLHAWTQREAVVKAFGGRLFTTPDPFPFRWPRPSRSVFRASTDASDLWSVLVPALDGAIATVVAAGSIERLQLWDASVTG